MKNNRWEKYDWLALMITNVSFMLLAVFLTWHLIGIFILLFLCVAVNFLILTTSQKRRSLAFSNEKKLLSHRIKQAGNYVFERVPLGIVLYDEFFRITWINPYASAIFNKRLTDMLIKDIDVNLLEKINASTLTFEYAHGEKVYLVNHLTHERVLYFDDITAYSVLLDKHEAQKASVGVITFDNYDEAIKQLDEQAQNDYRRQLTDTLNAWASASSILLRPTRDGRFLALMRADVLQDLCTQNFDILEKMKAIGQEEIVFTVSIGVASGYEDYQALYTRASALLDLALSRGGDQVVVKKKGEADFLFFGGKTNPMASGSRVRARVNAGAYERLVLDADQVIIMGHRYPDADALGASIGLLKVVQALGKTATIVLNETELDATNAFFVSELLKTSQIGAYFKSSKEILPSMTTSTLLVIVDTQDMQLVIDETLLETTKKIALFDHHRRGMTHIEALLSYTDISVSSTSELVVEMLPYFSKSVALTMPEASVMLAGMMLDTRRFMYNTSRRTYEAASVLKQKGADEKYITQLLKAPIENYHARAHLMQSARVVDHQYLISAADEKMTFEQAQLAIAADDLLNTQNIEATFIIGRIDDECVAISARSTGTVNVQRLMEIFGGGGHLTNAATRIAHTAIAVIVTQLEEALRAQ